MMRVVIDTNALLVSIPKISSTRWLFDAVLNGEVELAVTTEILFEYAEIINQFYNAPTLAENVITTLLNRPNVLNVTPYYFWYLIQEDPDDNKFVDCAIAANADYIITEDGHFQVLDTIAFPSVKHLTRAEFYRVLFS